MGSTGDAYDDEMWERFFGTHECELIDRQTFNSRVDARIAVFDCIEGWQNPWRRHSGIDYESPVSYERKQQAAA